MHEVRGRDTAAEVAGGGLGFEAVVGVATIVLAMVGLVATVVPVLAALLALGVAMLFSIATITAWRWSLMRVRSRAR